MLGNWRWGGSRRVWAGRTVVAGAAMLAVVGGLQLPASAATSPYTSGSKGFDVSYPQCSLTSYAGSGLGTGFAMVGVGDGRPFTSSPCAGAELAAAQTYLSSSGSSGLVGAYFNTGYAGAYAKSIDQTSCGAYANQTTTGATGSPHAVKSEDQAWAIGCSEAYYAEKEVTALGVKPATWWADIETGNSWSTNTALNYYTVKGMFWLAQNPSIRVTMGAYSNPSAWDKILGSYATSSDLGIQGDWQSLAGICQTSNGFSNSPLWVSQSGTTTVGSTSTSVDNDYGC